MSATAAPVPALQSEPMPTPAQLRKAEQRVRKADEAYRAAVERVRELRLARNEAIAEEVEAGRMRQLDAARVLGVTKGRLSQILADE